MKANRTLPKAAPEKALLQRAGRVVAFPSPWEPARKTAGIGVAIACGAVAMWYLPLFAAVMRLRLVHHDWPTAGALASALPWSASAVSAGLLSAVALTLAARATAVENTSSPDPSPTQKFFELVWPVGVVASAAFSIASMALHYRTCTTLAQAGLDLRSGPAGSVLFGFVMLDLAAMAVGAAALFVMSIRLAFGRFHPARPLPSSLWSVYLRCAACIAAVGFLVSFVAT